MDQAGVEPDIVTLSKALTGGTLPLAATVARRHVFEAFLSDSPDHALMHGPTYMGNALACAAANASLDLFETEPSLQQVARISDQLKDGLAPCRVLPGVQDVRVLGAIGVVEMDAGTSMPALAQALLQKGCWVRPFRKLLYLTPAFTISETELDQLMHSIVEAVRDQRPV